MNLFKKIIIKPNVFLSNRCIMGSMHTGLEEESKGFQKLAKFYALRAAGGVGLIVTGGISPNFVGRLTLNSSQLSYSFQIKQHALVTTAVHAEGAKICMQILHAGRYSYHPLNFAPSKIKSKINPFTPFKMSTRHIQQTIKDFTQCALLAFEAGYDGVEIMGSEGYLLNQFLCSRVNDRDDEWGGSFANRCKIIIKIIASIKAELPEDFIIIFRLSMLDLVEQGSSFEEVVELARLVKQAGADIINTGIGWHEARIPTIATSVPRGAFTWVTAAVKAKVDAIFVASNRINTPELAEAILAQKQADLVSLARPFLADPDFLNKAKNNQAHLINTCIACNQSCLDNAFAKKRASCLVNPQACYETERVLLPTTAPKNIAVIGAGPAGIAFAIYARKRGHQVTIYEKENTIGGQFNLASKVPGKEEFLETLRYFSEQIKFLQIKLKLNTELNFADFKFEAYNALVVASGVIPRKLSKLDYADKVVSYPDAFTAKAKKVAIIGAGGVGVDVAHFFAEANTDTALDLNKWCDWWGVDLAYKNAGALKSSGVADSATAISLLQRKSTKIGKNLGKTTGWIHRANLKKHQVRYYSSVDYKKIDDQGLHIICNQQEIVIDADLFVICAGQESNTANLEWIAHVDCPVHYIGGAKKAVALDAAAAIEDAFLLSLKI